MTGFQKAIKYVAIAFAILLIAAIISGICGALAGISHVLYKDDKSVSGGIVQEMEADGEIKNLDISIRYAELSIKEGSKAKAQTDNKYIDCSLDGNTLKVREKKHLTLFSSSSCGKVTVYLPEGTILDNARIETGAGTVSIDTLSAMDLGLDVGAGEVTAGELNAERHAEIDGGAGEINIGSGAINGLELDHGVGGVNLTSKLSGNNEIDMGVGEVNLHLVGNENDYSIRLDKGVGEATLLGERMRDNATYGTGATRVDIDGGVGEINVEFAPD